MDARLFAEALLAHIDKNIEERRDALEREDNPLYRGEIQYMRTIKEVIKTMYAKGVGR